MRLRTLAQGTPHERQALDVHMPGMVTGAIADPGVSLITFCGTRTRTAQGRASTGTDTLVGWDVRRFRGDRPCDQRYAASAAPESWPSPAPARRPRHPASSSRPPGTILANSRNCTAAGVAGCCRLMSPRPSFAPPTPTCRTRSTSPRSWPGGSRVGGCSTVSTARAPLCGSSTWAAVPGCCSTKRAAVAGTRMGWSCQPGRSAGHAPAGSRCSTARSRMPPTQTSTSTPCSWSTCSSTWPTPCGRWSR